MTAIALAQIGLFVLALLALVRTLGAHMARVYEGRPCGLDRVLGPVERLVYRLAGVRPDRESDWRRYAEGTPEMTASATARDICVSSV